MSPDSFPQMVGGALAALLSFGFLLALPVAMWPAVFIALAAFALLPLPVFAALAALVLPVLLASATERQRRSRREGAPDAR